LSITSIYNRKPLVCNSSSISYITILNESTSKINLQLEAETQSNVCYDLSCIWQEPVSTYVISAFGIGGFGEKGDWNGYVM